MAEKTQIEVTVSKDGRSVEYKVKGVQGKACTSKEFSFLDEALAADEKEQKLTEEYRKEKPKVQLIRGNG